MPNTTHKKHLFLLVILLLFKGIQVWAQDNATLYFKEFEAAQYLSNPWVTDVQFDKQGFLWIGTRDGLNRYDGSNLRVFRYAEKDSTSLASDNIVKLTLDNLGRLWISGNYNAASLYNPACQCFERLPQINVDGKNLTEEIFYPLHAEKNGGIWFSSRGNGLCYYNKSTKEAKRFPIPDIDSSGTGRDPYGMNIILDYYPEGEDIFWLATPNGLYKFNKKTFQYQRQECVRGENNIRVDYFSKIIPQKNEGFWLNTFGAGVTYFDKQTKKFSRYPIPDDVSKTYTTNVIYEMSAKDEDHLWIGSGTKNLAIFNKKTHVYQFPETPLTPNFIAFKLAAASNGVLFAMSDFKLFFHDPASTIFTLKPIRKENSSRYLDNIISSIVKDTLTQNLFVVSEHYPGVIKVNLKTQAQTLFPLSDPSEMMDWYSRVQGLVMSDNAQLWAYTRNLVFTLNQNRFDPKPLPDKLKGLKIKNLTQSQDKQWLLHSENGLLFRWDGKNNYQLINDTVLIANCPRKISQFASTKSGAFYLYAKGKLGYLENSQYWPLSGNFNDSLLATGVSHLVLDKNQQLWIKVNNRGLLKLQLQKDKVTQTLQFSKESGNLPTNMVYHITKDPYGDLWLSTVLGIIYLRTDNYRYQIFDHGTGVGRASPYLRFFATTDKNLLIANEGKYGTVDFKKLHALNRKPEVYFDNFRVLNETRLLPTQRDEVIVLNPSDNFFSFEFGALDFGTHIKNEFAYKLEGWDPDWVYCGNRRYASYSNLQGGNYTFLVKASTPEGVWTEPTRIKVYIKTPIYKQLWFLILVMMVIAGFIFLLYRLRIHSIEKTEKLKTEFNKKLAETRMSALRAQMNPHFIFNCLNSINRYIIKNDAKTASLYLTKFAKLIRHILDNSSHSQIALSKELESLKLYIEMESLRFENKFTFEITTAETIDLDSIEIPPLIIQPYVENAIWHGLLHKEGEGKLWIELKQIDHWLLIIVEDNGIGRKASEKYKSIHAPTRKSVGIKLTEERLKLGIENGQVNETIIEDLMQPNGEAAGTRVTLKIQLHEDN